MSLDADQSDFWRWSLGIVTEVPSGTVVHLKCKNGTFQVLLDGKVLANWTLKVPDDMDLYPLVWLGPKSLLASDAEVLEKNTCRID